MFEPFNGVQNNQLFPPQHFAEQENLQYFKVTKRLAEKRQNYKLELNTRNITHRTVTGAEYKKHHTPYCGGKLLPCGQTSVETKLHYHGRKFRQI